MREKQCCLRCSGRHRIAGEPQESDTVAVLKVKLHCPACVSEVTKSLQKLPGVMEVNVEANTEVIIVKGRKLEERKLCEGLWRKTGKRCEVVLFGSVEELMQRQHELLLAAAPLPPPAVQPEDMSLAPAAGGEAGAAPPGTAMVVADQAGPVVLQPSDQMVMCSQDAHTSAPVHDHGRPLHDVHEPRIEIKQQTHTVIYGAGGWPSQYQSPPYNYWAAYNAPLLDYYAHRPYEVIRYEEVFSDENPNACHIM